MPLLLELMRHGTASADIQILCRASFALGEATVSPSLEAVAALKAAAEVVDAAHCASQALIRVAETAVAHGPAVVRDEVAQLAAQLALAEDHSVRQNALYMMLALAETPSIHQDGVLEQLVASVKDPDRYVAAVATDAAIRMLQWQISTQGESSAAMLAMQKMLLCQMADTPRWCSITSESGVPF